MEVQFRVVLAGEARRRREPQNDPVVERFPGFRVDETPPLSIPWRRQIAGQRTERLPRTGAR
jgi:hypothetical protein